MMKKLFLYFTLICLNIFLFNVSRFPLQFVQAQTAFPEIIKNSPSRERYPTADAVVLLDERAITRESDGTIRNRTHHMIKIFTQIGIRDFAERRIQYNSKGESLNIITAKTYMADGTVVPVPENGFNILTPQAIASAPAYKDVREMVISFTSLEKNAIMELEAEIISKPHFLPLLSGSETFGNVYPVIQKVFSIAVPAEDSLLLYRSTYGCPGPHQKNESDKKIYTWLMDNVPLIVQEPASPPIEEQVPQLWYSTIPNWDKIVPVIRDHFSNASYVSSEIKEKTKKIITNQTTPLMQIEAIHKYVLDEITTISLQPRFLDYKFQQAEITFSQGTGNFCDKAVLLYGILQSAGFSVRIALTTERNILENILPIPDIFTRVYVIVQSEGEELWLDPTQELKPKDATLLNQTALIINNSGYEWQPFRKLTIQNNTANLNITLNLNTFQGTAHILIKGMYNPYYSLRSDADKKNYMQCLLKQLFSSVIVKNVNARRLDCTNGDFDVTFAFENVLNPANPYERFFINSHFLYPVFCDIPLIPTNRITPLLLPAPFTESITLNILTSKTWETSAFPETKEIKYKAGSYVSHIQKESGNIQWTFKTTISKNVLNPDEYDGIRTILTSENMESNRSLYFKFNN